MMLLGSFGMMHTEAMGLVCLVAALLVLVPLLWVLDRRTRAEWMKRHGYAGRLAYKLPVYISLGLLVAGKIMADITMLCVVLTSLVLIGTSADIGALYLDEFVPALVMAVVFGFSAWYVFKLAKGHDMGRQFSMLMAVIGAGLAVALLITAVSVAHSETTSPNNSYMKELNRDSLQDLFNY